MIGADGQRGCGHDNFASNELTYFNSTLIAGPTVAASDWDGDDGLTLPQLWDTHTQPREARRRRLPSRVSVDEWRATLQLRVAVQSDAGSEPDTQLLKLTASAAGRALGSRELQVRAADCHALPEALALVLALLARDAAPALPLPAAAQATDTSEPRAKPTREPAPREQIALAAGAGAFFGVLPSAALALQLQAATPGELLSLRLKAGMLRTVPTPSAAQWSSTQAATSTATAARISSSAWSAIKPPQSPS